MSEKPDLMLDDDPEEFREAAHRAVDWIVDYFANIESLPVLSDRQPGWVASQLPAKPSEDGRPYEEILRDFDSKIIPGVTHWNHPGFMAYFAITGSRAGILADMLTAALNVNGMLWKTSPALTELELVTLRWLRELLGLPDDFFGIINDTASVNTFLALAAARESLGLSIRKDGMSGRTLPLLRVYFSDQAHSSVDKAVMALGIGMRGIVKIESDEAFRMKPEALERAIRDDRAAGFLPCAIVATAGTTSTASIDPVRAIAEIAAREKIWLHVDAAYGGSAAIAPEYRYVLDGVDLADSIVVNPHKWLFTQFDCGVLYTRHPEKLRETFSLVPEYLKTPEDSEVVNFMDYGIQLGRRFRALKLWFVFEHYGIEKLRSMIRQHVDFAERLAAALQMRDDVELIAPQSLGVVVFRRVVRNPDGSIDEPACERETDALLGRINASGEIYVSHTKLRDRLGIRVAIGNGATTWVHVEKLLALV